MQDTSLGSHPSGSTTAVTCSTPWKVSLAFGMSGAFGFAVALLSNFRWSGP